MTKSLAKAQDQLVAEELGLKVSPFTLVLHRMVSMENEVQGFVFMYIKDGLLHYDTADTWNEVNGRRIKIKKFKLSPTVKARLQDHFYKRWYIRSGETLYPMQIAKYDKLYQTIYFLTDDYPNHQSSIIPPKEVPFIRRQSLLFHRKPHPGWGVTYKPRTVSKYAVAT